MGIKSLPKPLQGGAYKEALRRKVIMSLKKYSNSKTIFSYLGCAMVSPPCGEPEEAGTL
jgi:hypothetical protein